MQQIINFIIRYKNFLLYIFLLTISLALTIQSHSYHQSRFFNSSSWISGGIYKASSNFFAYFDLNDANKKLIEENERLRHQLFNKIEGEVLTLDSVQQKYMITSGRIIKNSYANPRNYITIDKGANDSIEPDMGVITDKGILGIVENTSDNFATVQSILNEKSNINAKIKNSDQFGSLVWDTQNYNSVQLIDIPRMAKLTVGDTIVTGAMSSIFPENIPIGTIQRFDLNTSKSLYTIHVSLFNDMTNIKHIYIVKNIARQEILELESDTDSHDQ